MDSNTPSKPLPPGRGFHRSDEFDDLPPRKPLPGILTIGISALVALHFLALGAHVLAYRSGPWPTPFDVPSPAEPPKFAQAIDDLVFPWYLDKLRMTHNYHFATNQTEAFDVYFEVRLKDAAGKVVKSLKFPEEGGNTWVRHRQKQLAQALFGDQPLQPPQTERVPSPLVLIWKIVEPESTQQKAVYVLDKILEHNIPRDRPSMRPTEWSVAVAKSYVRHLCREHGAASGELIRHSREAIPAIPSPEVVNVLPPDTFVEMVANFGEYKP